MKKIKKTAIQYLLFLGGLTLIIVISQVLIQKSISESKTDSRIVNVSGRQRMLSQKISKSAMRLQASNNEKEYLDAQEELSAACKLLVASHLSLMNGNEELDVSKMNNSVVLKRLFGWLLPFYETMVLAVHEIEQHDYAWYQISQNREILAGHIKKINESEDDFLKLMNDITFEYDHLSSEKVENLSISEFYLFGITLLLIALEAVFIFRPMINKAKKKEAHIGDLHGYVQESIKVLGQTEYQKRNAEAKILTYERQLEESKKQNEILTAKLKKKPKKKVVTTES